MFKAPRAGPTSHITRLPNYLGGVLARRRCESYGTFIIPTKTIMAPTEMAWVQFPRDISIATDLWQVGATLVLLALISLLPPIHQEIIDKEYIILLYYGVTKALKIHWKWCIG